MALTSYVMQPTPGSDLRRYASAELQKIEKSIGSIIIDSTDIRAALEAAQLDIANAQDDIIDLFAADVVADLRLDALEPVAGSWTPRLEGGATPGVGTYSLQEGWYLKTGRLVTFKGRMIWSAHTGSGDAWLVNLPYTSDSAGSSNIYWTGTAYAGGLFRGAMLLIRPNLTTTFIYDNANPRVSAQITASGDFIFGGSYWTA